jgi:ADP-ribosyl-[dinitrogen reductase] hydrolase
MNARTFENAVLSAINLGGDADTVGACCGALAGAYWGIDAVPERWTAVLEGYSGIQKVADALWQGRRDGLEGRKSRT